MTLLSIVIPCFNSSSWLGELVDSVVESFRLTDYEIEVILVNDSSTDGSTWGVIESCSENHESVIGIDLLKNSGQFASTLCGMSKSSGDYVVTMDDDWQHSPKDILTILSKLEGDPGIDGAIAKWEKKKHGIIRKIGSKIYNYILRKSTGSREILQMTSFRVLRRPLVDSLLRNDTSKPIMGMLLLKASDSLVNVDIPHHSGKRRKSEYGFYRLVKITLSNIIDATTAPLRIFALVGVAIFSTSFIIASILAYFRISGDISVPGYTSMIIAINIYGGLSMIGIGIIGEYIGRMVPDVRRENAFGIRRTTLEEEP